MAKGRSLYKYYCSHCHGPKGQGNGFNAKNLDPQPRDLTDSIEPTLSDRTHDEIFEVISKGGREMALSPYMPPFGNTLSEEEIWSLVAYIRTLHPNQAEKIDFSRPMQTTRPQSVLADQVDLGLEAQEALNRLVKIGERFYTEKYGCDGCHRINGMGGEVGPDLSVVGFRLQTRWISRWLSNPQVVKPETKMPNFRLPDRDIKAITLYLKSLTQKSPPTLSLYPDILISG